MNSDLEERIRARAHHIWENNPESGNSAEENWEKARRQIEAESVSPGADGDGADHGADQSADREHRGRLAREDQLQDLSEDNANEASS